MSKTNIYIYTDADPETGKTRNMYFSSKAKADRWAAMHLRELNGGKDVQPQEQTATLTHWPNVYDSRGKLHVVSVGRIVVL